jgi:hypothetical protein
MEQVSHFSLGSMKFIPSEYTIDFTELNKKSEESFNPSFIFFDTNYYFLKKDLNCKIYQKDNLFFVECPYLKISVWGKNKEEVLNAFNFSFHALVQNFANDDDSNLSLGARKLKNKIKSILA